MYFFWSILHLTTTGDFQAVHTRVFETPSGERSYTKEDLRDLDAAMRHKKSDIYNQPVLPSPIIQSAL